ncbi:predicted protein [Botrytis cinerea T4]|uniref:Uncharacterized protein n=1 Tax=Botryotinia fuckeliana (strain T4) TaxID=999810 RepID=G2Y877_BOTF4|nr:predicted protein [Botrytis cinerea T4]
MYEAKVLKAQTMRLSWLYQNLQPGHWTMGDLSHPSALSRQDYTIPYPLVLIVDCKLPK